MIMGLFRKRRAKQRDKGKRFKILWNPQGVRDFGEKPNYRKGTISHVSDDGGFDLEFDCGGVMIFSASIRGRRVNPFRKLSPA